MNITKKEIKIVVDGKIIFKCKLSSEHGGDDYDIIIKDLHNRITNPYVFWKTISCRQEKK